MTIIPYFVWFEAGGARSLFDRIGSQKSQFLNYSRVMIISYILFGFGLLLLSRLLFPL
jgi:hypothetical protein